jgi:hypothetical protein
VQYAAMIIDIKNSRQLDRKNRIQAQKDLKFYIDNLNEVYSSTLKYSVVFSSGDSVQGLFFHPKDALSYYHILKVLMNPILIRCGIGIGELTIDLEGMDSNSQDGPAYYRAQEAVEILKANQGNVLIHSNTSHDLFINGYLHTIEIIEQDLTSKRKLIAQFIHLFYPIQDSKILHPNYQQLCHAYIQHDSLENHFALTSVDEIIKLRPNLEESDLQLKQNHYLLKPVPTFLSSLLGTTRQNNEQMIKKGKLNEIRHLHILCERFLNDYYDLS